jgi:hypothetical protein
VAAGQAGQPGSWPDLRCLIAAGRGPGAATAHFHGTGSPLDAILEATPRFFEVVAPSSRRSHGHGLAFGAEDPRDSHRARGRPRLLMGRKIPSGSSRSQNPQHLPHFWYKRAGSVERSNSFTREAQDLRRGELACEAR